MSSLFAYRKKFRIQFIIRGQRESITVSTHDEAIVSSSFRNLRRSKATEIADQFGMKAESEWIGHGVQVSMMSYQIVTDEKFKAATGNSGRRWTPDHAERLGTDTMSQYCQVAIEESNFNSGALGRHSGPS